MRDNGSDLSKVCVSLVTNMNSAFLNKNWWSQDISSWDVSNVTDMSNMFRSCYFDRDISNWDVSSVTNMHDMFGYSWFNKDIGNWDVSSVTDMSNMFDMNSSFNQDIGSWDVSNVTTMQSMFRSALHLSSAFNQDIGSWDVSSVTNMLGMFLYSSNFNQDLSGWCVTNIPSKPSTFSQSSGLSAANHPVWGTCPSAINPNPLGAYVDSVAPGLGCIVCDQYAAGDTFSLDGGTTWYTAVDRSLLNTMRDNGDDLSKVCVSLVTDMGAMFFHNDSVSSTFNQDISSWDVSNVTRMDSMFMGSTVFNQDIGNWDVSNVTDMSSMFSWTADRYTNVITGFPLQPRHRKLECIQCHRHDVHVLRRQCLQ